MDRVDQAGRAGRKGRALPCFMSLWPGLPGLWRHGSWIGLLQALAFAFLLQVTVFTSLIWPESLGMAANAVVWFCVLGFWVLFAAPVFMRALAAWRGGFSTANFEHLFIAAQREYLRGNWHQAERNLTRLLSHDSGDVDARLMLASLFRHAGRPVAAKEQLDLLVESPDSSRWNFEVLHERSMLSRAISSSDIEDDPDRDGNDAARDVTDGDMPGNESEPQAA